METLGIIAIVAAVVLLLVVAYLVRDRLSHLTFRLGNVGGSLTAKAPESPQARGLFRFEKNRLRRRSRFSVPNDVGFEATKNDLSDSTIEIRDPPSRQNE
jgi:hypothetical protein